MSYMKKLHGRCESHGHELPQNNLKFVYRLKFSADIYTCLLGAMSRSQCSVVGWWC
jgi:hypothetical protein